MSWTPEMGNQRHLKAYYDGADAWATLRFENSGEAIDLRDAQFHTSCNGYDFGPDANFSGSGASKDIEFRHCKFGDKFRWRGMAATAAISFINCEFGENVSFAEGRFGELRFQSCHFKGHVDFQKLYGKSLTVRQCSAVGSLAFDHANLNLLSLDGLSASGVDATEIMVSQEMTIHNCRLDGILKIHASSFLSNVEITASHFTCASFSGSRFFSLLGVHDCSFRNGVFFTNAHLSSMTTFSRSSFVGFDLSCDIKKDREELSLGHISFYDCHFWRYALFNNRRFDNSTKFHACKFHVAPHFHNSDLHQGTDFLQTVFQDRSGDGAEQAYRTLKLAMNKHHAHAEEMMFFGLEMRARRYKEPWHSAWLYWLYEKLSDYGQSIVRPLAAILGSFVFFLATYWFVLFNGRLEEIAASDGMARIGKLYVFTLTHALPFLLPFLKQGETLPWPKNVDQPALVTALVGLQTTIALALFFLLLLGLRNRFRLKS